MTNATIENKVKSVISNIRNLPTPPIVFHQIQKVINDPNVNATKIANILAEDPAMSVKVLRLTNSAFYGLSKEIESVKQAVVIVGFEAIKNLVLSASVLDMFKDKSIDQEAQEKYWRHSLSTALCCRILARQIKSRGIVDPDSAFSAGLLHDVGKMIFSCFLPEEYAEFKEQRTSDMVSQDFEVEDRAFGYTHAQIGSFLGTMWKIPQKLTDAIYYHHTPMLYHGEDAFPHIVYLANWLSKKTFYDATDVHLVGEIDPEVLGFLDVSEEKLEVYGDMLREEYAKSETFMQMVGISA